MEKYATYEALAERYAQVNEQIKELEAEKKALNASVKEAMGDEPTLELSNGWHFTKSLVEITAYAPLTLIQCIGIENALPYLKVGNKRGLEEYINLMVKTRPEDPAVLAIPGKLAATKYVESTQEKLLLVQPK